MSVKINRRTMDRCTNALAKLDGLVQEYVLSVLLDVEVSIIIIFILHSIKEYDTNRLNEEYQNMVQGLRLASAQRDADLVLANPILPDDILQGMFYLNAWG